MGLKCSLLGHSFEPAGTEEDHQEQGSKVVTAVREIEACTRCGETRVVSETTEVTTVVDADEVDLDESELHDMEGPTDEPADGLAGTVERSETDENVDEPADGTLAGGEESETASRAAAAVDELAESPDADDGDLQLEDRDPEEEDAEILTDDDDEDERAPGEWPDDGIDDPTSTDDDVSTSNVDDDVSTSNAVADSEEEPAVAPDDEERLAGITVPEGQIVCPECDFRIDADSSYRDGDPCPECGAWLLEDDA